MKRELAPPLVSAAVLGLFSTLGDWVWANYIPDGAVVPGVVHGVAIFVLLAVVLGWATGAGGTKRLLVTLPLVGFLLAAAFYPLAYAIGYLGALLATWVGMWISLALSARWASGGEEALALTLTRGLVAAVASGLAFWAISGIWTNPAQEVGYALRFLYWTFAFLPGFFALLFRRDSRSV